MREESSNTKWIILTLVIVIVLLIGIIAYYFWLKPAYDNFIQTKQQEAYSVGVNVGLAESQKAFLNGVRSNIVQFGYVQITFEDNQTVYLAPFNPNQMDQQAIPEEVPLA